MRGRRAGPTLGCQAELMNIDILALSVLVGAIGGLAGLWLARRPRRP